MEPISQYPFILNLGGLSSRYFLRIIFIVFSLMDKSINELDTVLN